MTHAIDSFIAEWERARSQRQTREFERLARVRHECWQRVLSLGLPTTRDEEWRFTSVAPIAERAFTSAPGTPHVSTAEIDRRRLPSALTELVFVNGRFDAALSIRGALPQGAHVGSLAERLSGDRELDSHLARVANTDRHPFAALNTSLFEDGAFLWLPPRAIVDRPVHLLFVTTAESTERPLMTHPRVLIVAGAQAQASVVETYAGTDGADYLTNTVTEIVLGENAVVDHYRIQDESTHSSHVGAVHIHASRNAVCTAHSVSLGGALVRNDVVAVLDGEGGECALNGLYLADAQRLVDNHTTIDHARPHCASREVYKGILADRARGVFNGKIIVRPDAQKTDAKQTSRALLLSEDALINTKPQLEIFANDVKCTHGAAVGQLDEEAMFYLRSRGLDQAMAQRMLIHAFAADVLHRLPLAEIRAAIEHRLQQQLARALPEAGMRECA